MKTPFFIILVLFISAYILVSQFGKQQYSTESIIFSKSVPPKILMFSSKSCRYCSTARSFFDYHKLSYKERDIDTSDKNRQMFYLMGGKGTPLIIVNKDIIHGFDEYKIRKAL